MLTPLLDETQILSLALWGLGIIAFVVLGGLVVMFLNRHFTVRLVGVLLALLLGCAATALSNSPQAETPLLLLFTPFLLGLVILVLFPRELPA